MALPKVSFLARMTRQPELTFSQSGIAVCKCGLACSEKYNDKETTLFIDGTCFKKTAEMIANIGKGQRVFVIGKIQTDKWQDKNSGENRSKTVMIIESFEFIEPRDHNQQHSQNRGFQQQGQQNNTGFQQQPQQQGFQNQQQLANNGGFQQPDDDIPF